MVNFPGHNAPDLTELFGYPSDVARNGFQGAHIYGTARRRKNTYLAAILLSQS